MRNSTVEKLRSVLNDGDVTYDKIRFIQSIMSNEECPIVLETNKDYFVEELEKYKFESKDTNTIIQKKVVPLYGNIKYFTSINVYGNFTEVKDKPIIVDSNYIAYIVESKIVNGDVKETTILDEKILIFLDINNIAKLHTYHPECHIIYK